MDKAYLVQSKEDEEKLAHYETLAYAARACRITSTHGNEPATVIGKTFMYAGDPEALRQGRSTGSCGSGNGTRTAVGDERGEKV